MYNFDTSENTSNDTTDNISDDTSSVQVPPINMCKIDTSCDTSLEPLYKQNKPLNKPRECINENSTLDINKNSIPEESEVNDFFRQESLPEIEGKKFYLHFQSIGWKIGGKTPLDDWKAAARKWMLNLPEKKANRFLIFKKEKNYGEPL